MLKKRFQAVTVYVRNHVLGVPFLAAIHVFVGHLSLKGENHLRAYHVRRLPLIVGFLGLVQAVQ